MGFDFSKLKFSFDLSKADYQLDRLQNQLLQFYLRADRRFRRAFSTNYTADFLGYIKDKAKLREPVHLSCMSPVRTGKTYTMMTTCIYHQAQYNRLFSSEYICANAFEFLEKIKSMPQEKLVDRIFLVDEQKQTIFSVGSTAKKMKIEDVNNIIAINNISTIMINPTKWANPDTSAYGLRVFGRCFETKTCRMMLYNLQEKGRGGELPLGCIYLPIFTAFLPEKEGKQLEKEYLKRKHEWVTNEQRGTADVLYEIKRKSAYQFMRDKQYLSLKKKAEKIVYIGQKLGSEWTTGEKEEIYQITKLLEQGIELEKD